MSSFMWDTTGSMEASSDSGACQHTSQIAETEKKRADTLHNARVVSWLLSQPALFIRAAAAGTTATKTPGALFVSPPSRPHPPWPRVDVLTSHAAAPPIMAWICFCASAMSLGSFISSSMLAPACPHRRHHRHHHHHHHHHHHSTQRAKKAARVCLVFKGQRAPQQNPRETHKNYT